MRYRYFHVSDSREVASAPATVAPGRQNHRMVLELRANRAGETLLTRLCDIAEAARILGCCSREARRRLSSVTGFKFKGAGKSLTTKWLRTDIERVKRSLA